MTEAARIYHQDVAEKSKQKNSAYHKKGGSAVTKLGNKQDSWMEIMEKHGPIATYPSTDNLMEYSDFVRLPNDLKIEFVNKICDKYDIDIKHISKYLFNKGDDGLRAYLRNNKILQQCNPQKKRAKSGLLQFEADVTEWKRRVTTAKEIDIQEAKMKQEVLPPLMSCKEFLKMTLNDKVFYINSLVDTYQIPLSCISSDLFENDANWLSNHFSRFGKSKEVRKIPHKLSHDPKWVAEHGGNFKRAIEEWKALLKDSVDISPAEEPKPVKEKKMIEKAPEVPVEEKKVPEVKKLLPDEEFKLEETPVVNADALTLAVDPEQLWDKGVVEQLNARAANESLNSYEKKEPATEPEVDPFVYHEMHFSSNYIHMGLNMEEIYMIAELFKNKKVKVHLEVTEV